MLNGIIRVGMRHDFRAESESASVRMHSNDRCIVHLERNGRSGLGGYHHAGLGLLR